MNKVAVMTDRTSSMAQEVAERFDIKMVPFHIIMDGKDYLDTEVDMEDLYARVAKKENLPTTSFPAPEEFLQAYQELSQNAEAILHISLTPAFSGGYNAALEAKEIAQKELPKTTIEVIDSQISGSGLALIVLAAAKAAKQGKNIEEVAEQANYIIQRISYFSAPDTLFYLDKGGRICQAKSWAEAQQVSSFRALIEIAEGTIKPAARAKTKTEILEKMVSIAKERVGNKKIHVAMTHNKAPQQVEELKKMLLSQFQCEELYVFEGLAMTVVHTGQGLLDFGFYGSD
ncbi:MAG: DegV family protein [Dehalococcoidales bacterium]|nr:DegV family protein [Dehalococcoidales bacterium]